MAVVATYNIHSCVGIDGRLDPQRIADVIAELGADIIALQEVEAHHRSARSLDQWAFLAAATGYHCTAGVTYRTRWRSFGNAILTRSAVSAPRLHDISFGGREPRGAIDAMVKVDGHAVRVVATHFGLRRAERRYQAIALSAIVAGKSGDAKAEATLVLGDLNEWHPRSRSLDALLVHFEPALAPRSFPAPRALFALDRIAVAGGANLAAIGTHRSKLARIASDHLPVRATFAWD